MHQVLVGRHNEERQLIRCGACFLLGTCFWLVLYTGYGAHWLETLPFDWTQFWNTDYAWQGIWPAGILLAVVLILGSWPVGRGVRYLIFLLEGFVFSICISWMCVVFSDIGVYLALYALAAPVFLLTFSQFLWLIPVLDPRKRVLFVLLTLLLLIWVRQWGFETAGDLYRST